MQVQVLPREPGLPKLRTFRSEFSDSLSETCFEALTDPLKRLAYRIITLRKARGLTRAELAERAGLHYVSLGRIEKGKENVTILTLSKIARALGVSLSDLLELGEGKDIAVHDLDSDASDGSILKRLGKRISELQGQRGWSQRELARRAGLHYVTICRIEKGQRNIAFLDALRIAEVLEVGVGEVLRLHPPPLPDALM